GKGWATAEELGKAEGAVWQRIAHTEDYDWSEDKQSMLQAASAVGHAARQPEGLYPLSYLAGCAALSARNASVYEGLREADVQATQSALLRDILGPVPFRPVPFQPTWRTPTARGLAQAIYDGRAFDGLPILADALEEAGCDSGEVLAHCRSGGVHVRGCWVLDALLGKE